MQDHAAALVIQARFRALTCPLSSAFIVPKDRFLAVHNQHSQTMYSAKALYEYFDNYASNAEGQMHDPVTQRAYNKVEQMRLFDTVRKRPVRSQYRKRKVSDEITGMEAKIARRSHPDTERQSIETYAQEVLDILVEQSIKSITTSIVNAVGRLKESDIYVALCRSELSDYFMDFIDNATDKYFDSVYMILAHNYSKEDCLQVHHRCADMIENCLKLVGLDQPTQTSAWKYALRFRKQGSKIVDMVANARLSDAFSETVIRHDLMTRQGMFQIVVRRLDTNRPDPPPLPEES